MKILHSYLHLNLFQPLSMHDTLFEKYFIMAWWHYFTDFIWDQRVLMGGYTKVCHDAILELVWCKWKKGCSTSACNCQTLGLHCTDIYSCSEECVNGGKEEDTERVELDFEDNVNADLNANFNWIYNWLCCFDSNWHCCFNSNYWLLRSSNAFIDKGIWLSGQKNFNFNTKYSVRGKSLIFLIIYWAIKCA